MDGWDEQLLAAGQFLIKKREEFVYFLDEMMAKIHGQLTGGKEQIKVEYEKNVEAEKFRAVSYTHLIYSFCFKFFNFHYFLPPLVCPCSFSY